MEPVSYHIDEGTFVAFQRLISARAAPRFALFMAGVGLVVSLIGAVLGAHGAVIGAIGGAAVGAIGLPLIARWLVIPRQARKTYREYGLLHEEMTLALDHEGFAISQASGNVRMNWDSVVLWNEGDTLLTIHPTRHMAYILPKQAIGEERSEFIRQSLAAHGLAKQGKRRK